MESPAGALSSTPPRDSKKAEGTLYCCSARRHKQQQETYPQPEGAGKRPSLVHRGELQHVAAELGSYKQAHTSPPPLTLGNSRVVEGPAPLKELGSRAQAMRGGPLPRLLPKPHCTGPSWTFLRVVSLLEGGPTSPFRAEPGRVPWAKTRPPGARLRAPTPGLAPGWGPGNANPGEHEALQEEKKSFQKTKAVTLGFRRNNAVFVLVVEQWTSSSSIPSAGCLRGFMEFAQPVHMCFVDLEKAFDRVPRGILWGVLLDERSQGPEGVRFGNHRISSLLFADDVVLLASSSQDLQHVLERFAAECEAAGMRISTSKSEAMVLDRKRVVCPLRVSGEVLPQVEEFKYLGVLFTSEGKMEREIDRRIGAASMQLCGRCTGPSW
ncbi:hypothetical protein L3Q82_018256 [Scortum barcoo]|uniref:Uncharacterized protein n=1 Tax=Scortum barcoo TaxID=214431 RepID=A0ACB8VKI9_9TELE|nr:hypothetical protein L3Q82_018256 [Scortum barcoo]